MGTVFEAIQLDLVRPCAVKLLLPSESPTANARFLREARFASRINHPNVVSIIAHGKDPERNLSYIAMEHIQGESLEKTLQREKRLSWSRTRHIITQICRALEAAHRCGVVHRDLKPANCMRTTSDGDADTMKLVDFGIAKAPEEIDRTKLTVANAPIGTVDYMAYEQASGFDDVDQRADVWAAGVIVYEMVSGVLPFRSAPRTQMQRLVAILTTEPIPLSATVATGSVPPGLSEIIDKALQKDRSLRYASVAEFRTAIEGLGALVASPSTDSPSSRPTEPTPPTERPTRVPLSPLHGAGGSAATGLQNADREALSQPPRRAPPSMPSPVGPTELHPADVLTVATKPSLTGHTTAPPSQKETQTGLSRGTWFIASASILFLVLVLVWKVSCGEEPTTPTVLPTATSGSSTTRGDESTSTGPSTTGPGPTTTGFTTTGPSTTGPGPTTTGLSTTGLSTGGSTTGPPTIVGTPPDLSVKEMCKQLKKAVKKGFENACHKPPPTNPISFTLMVNGKAKVLQVTPPAGLSGTPLANCVIKLLKKKSLRGKPARKSFNCSLF